jgi:hypothetical protein
VIDARLEDGRVDLYDASSGMYRRTIRTGTPPTGVRCEGDEVEITVTDGTVEIYNADGSTSARSVAKRVCPASTRQHHTAGNDAVDTRFTLNASLAGIRAPGRCRE